MLGLGNHMCGKVAGLVLGKSVARVATIPFKIKDDIGERFGGLVDVKVQTAINSTSRLGLVVVQYILEGLDGIHRAVKAAKVLRHVTVRNPVKKVG